MHAGITPRYRGVHGGYWALAEDNPHLVGTTVHFVDTGIDTGGILDQAFFEIGASDNFVTYPYLHTKAGIPVLLDAVKLTLSGGVKVCEHSPAEISKLRHHPTIWFYLYNRLRKGVK
jgi:methionyl-tRNA formyltransferase